VSDWVSDYYADVDALRLDAYVQRHAADASVVFGNNPPAVGHTAIAETVGGLFAALSGMRHEQRNKWFVDGGDTAVVEVLVHYRTKGGAEVAVPAVSLLDRGPDGLVRSLRVHIDMAPVFAALADEAADRTEVVGP
jgi:ketosteroid isomerase-like protein